MLSHTSFGKSLSRPSGVVYPGQNKLSALGKVETGQKTRNDRARGSRLCTDVIDIRGQRKWSIYDSMQFYDINVVKRQWIYLTEPDRPGTKPLLFVTFNLSDRAISLKVRFCQLAVFALVNSWVHEKNWNPVSCSVPLANLKSQPHRNTKSRSRSYLLFPLPPLFAAQIPNITAKKSQFLHPNKPIGDPQNVDLMTFALTWCANIFVGCSVTPTFLRQITSFSDSFHYTAWEVLIISHILLKKGRIGTWIEVCVA